MQAISLSSTSLDRDIAQLRQLLEHSGFTVVITGAGISMSIGILDMEHMNVTKVMQTSIERLVRIHPERSYKLLREAFLNPMFTNGPSITHRKIAEFEQRGLVQGVITTNIDHLHSLAGTQHVAEIQGSYGINRCVRCELHHDDIHIWNQGKAPRCRECGGVVVSFPVYTHVGVSPEDYKKAIDWVSQAELVIITGSKGMYGGYLDHLNPRADIVVINPKLTPFDSAATLVIRSQADPVFEAL